MAAAGHSNRRSSSFAHYELIQSLSDGVDLVVNHAGAPHPEQHKAPFTPRDAQHPWGGTKLWHLSNDPQI